MVDQSLPVVCRICSRKVRLDQIRFDEVKKAYICMACFSSGSREAKIGVVEDKKTRETLKGVDSFNDSLIKYTCEKCKYYFARRKEKKVTHCPYCGSERLTSTS